MKPGQLVQVLPSYTLAKMGMKQLVGKEAAVISVVEKNGKTTGCWCEFDSEWNGDKEWFIPINSLVEI